VSESTSRNPGIAGRTILITGAGDGLGAALARACGVAGAEVVLLGRTVRKLEAVYDEILAAGGPEPAIYPLDLEGAAPNEYAELAERVREGCGRLDALVHNAAALGDQTPLEFYRPIEWARVLQVNLNGPLLLTQACLPLLRESGHGHIVFVDDPQRGAYWGAYGVSKAAVGAMAEMLQAETEQEPGLHVHRFDPGPMRTGLRNRAFPGALADESPLPAESAVPRLLDLLAGR
jgi:NAD(P)-dependent dehydrogenase (short-subunit alcohol dehydrogenase family)